MNTNVVCVGSGQNKKDAKFICARNALSLIAPNIYKKRWDVRDEDLDGIINRIVDYKVQFMKPKKEEKDDEVMSDSKEDDALIAETITLGDPRLRKLNHLFEPYAPYTLLK